MPLLKHIIFLILWIIVLSSCSSNESSKQLGSANKMDSTSQSLNAAGANPIYLHALSKLYTVGDFDGDGKTDTLFQHNYSLLRHTEIDSAADPFKNEWDTVVNWFYRQDPQIYICFNKINTDTLKLGAGQGLYCLLNIGDNNKDGKDEIAFVVDYLDYSRVNSCKIFSLCENKWLQLKQIGIHEDAFNFNSEVNPNPVFPEINEYLEKRKGKWMYKDYLEDVMQSKAYTEEMNTLIIEKCVPDIKGHAQQILDGTLMPTDSEEITFRILDSLFCQNKKDQVFYFLVANKIQQLSDGALSEYVSEIANEFYFNNNSYFLERTQLMSTKDLYRWLDYAAFDIAGDAQEGLKDLPKIKVRLQKLVLDNPPNKVMIEKCNQYLLKEIEEQIKFN